MQSENRIATKNNSADLTVIYGLPVIKKTMVHGFAKNGEEIVPVCRSSGLPMWGYLEEIAAGGSRSAEQGFSIVGRFPDIFATPAARLPSCERLGARMYFLYCTAFYIARPGRTSFASFSSPRTATQTATATSRNGRELRLTFPICPVCP